MSIQGKVAAAALRLECLKLAFERRPDNLAPPAPNAVRYDPYAQAEIYWNWATGINQTGEHPDA